MGSRGPVAGASRVHRATRAGEGGARFSAGDAWTNAQLARGRDLLVGGRREALAASQRALEFPESLRAERREGTGGRTAEVHFWIGEAQQARGERAEAVLWDVLDRGTAALLDAPKEIDFFSSFGEQRPDRRRAADAHYLVGLGRLGLHDEAGARAAFEAALAASPDHLGARQKLNAFGRPKR